ncbi:MAG TPA: hypothetical protein VF424_03595, partial [Vicinamibacterales bacterium]
IYLADRANNRVQVFRKNGEFVREKILRPRCGAQEQATWAPKRPCGTEAAFSIGFSHDAPQTYVYVADGGSHFITVLRRSDLEVVSEFGGPGVGPGQLGRPHNLSVDPSGNIFVAEAAGPSVKNAAGESVEAGFRAQKFTFKGTQPAAKVAGPRAVEDRSREPRELSRGQTVILGTYSWDVETDSQRGPTRNDVWWQQVRAGVQFLTPQAGAGFAIVTDIPFDALGQAELSKLRYLPDRLANTSLLPGTVFGLRTSEGNFARVKVIGYRDSHDFSFDSAQIVPEDRRAWGLKRPNIKNYHLELSWVLFEK